MREEEADSGSHYVAHISLGNPTIFTYNTHSFLERIPAIMASAAKKRKMNFSEREVEILVEEIEKQKHTIVNHFNAGVTHMAKNKAWGDILKKVNAVTTCPRELHEVKKKWSDMKTEVRRKVAQARAAIEGTAADSAAVPVILSAMQQRICNLLGEATIISLPAGDPDAELTLPVTVNATVSLAESKFVRQTRAQRPGDPSLTSAPQVSEHLRGSASSPASAPLTKTLVLVSEKFSRTKVSPSVTVSACNCAVMVVFPHVDNSNSYSGFYLYHTLKGGEKEE